MPSNEWIPESDSISGRNLLLQELRETLERARLGGFFYPIAIALAFTVTSREYLVPALVITGYFFLLAISRLSLRLPESPGADEIRRPLLMIWSLILTTAFSWGAFSAWSYLVLPEPAPLVSVLFSGAFGMALAHSMCMRRLPAGIAILSVMLPSLVLLWVNVSPGVAVMWAVYMTYMLLVLLRSYGEYRARLEIEEDLRRQRDLFEKQSLLDSLTGIANRRVFTEVLARLPQKAQSGDHVSLLILDVDHFKNVNDSFGHASGDACLVAMAQRLQAHFDQPGDLPVRLGGEEFGVVMNCDGDSAFARAERFRQDLESTPLAFEGGQARVTVSIGYGQYDPFLYSDTDAFYLAVDKALYRSKQAGRNRTECAEPGIQPQPTGVAPVGAG
jgi:diguanylate cyclase (GGDEF)-like protein